MRMEPSVCSKEMGMGPHGSPYPDTGRINLPLCCDRLCSPFVDDKIVMDTEPSMWAIQAHGLPAHFAFEVRMDARGAVDIHLGASNNWLRCRPAFLEARTLPFAP